MIEKRYHFTPVKVEVDEQHVGVYASKSDGNMVKADHPKALLYGSIISQSLATAVMNGKYVNVFIVPTGAGIHPLWSFHSKKEHGKLDDSSRRGIPGHPL